MCVPLPPAFLSTPIAHRAYHDVAQGRPAPYMIFRAMERTGITSVAEVLNIGDTVLDIQSGRKFALQGLQTAAGVPLLSQSVLLKGVNADAATLETLFRALIRNRVKPYYLHHCDMARGAGHFRTTIAEGQDIMAALRGRLSGTCLPTYVLDLPGGHGTFDTVSNSVTITTNQGGTLVVVGTLHLLGDDGVVDKLKAKGFTVERVCTGCAKPKR